MVHYKGINKGTALVTGGAVRIGKSIALYLASQGYDIALHYNSSKTEAEKVAKEIKKLGRKCELFKYNLSDTKQVHALTRAVTAKFKNWKVLVNNAAIFERHSFLESDEDIFNRHFNINFKAPFFLSRAFARTQKSGNIINIADSYMTKTKSPFFVYQLTKKSLYEFTRMAASELAPDIRVNAVAPGVVLPSKQWGDDYIEKKKKAVPMKKIATLDDINNTISYILENGYITGECFFVDGGEKLI